MNNDSTKIIHKGRNPLKHNGTVNPPISQSSTIIFPTLEAYDAADNSNQEHYEKIYNAYNTDISYGIAGSTTQFAFSEMISSLENADASFITTSGLSAITLTLSAFTRAGDHILIIDNCYSPTRRFANKVLARNGVEVEYFAPHDDISKLIKPNTKLIFFEAPGSITFEICDIEKILKLAKKHNIVTAVDNSWATPLYFKPLDIGIDVSISAVTKYINGHSDVLMGSIAVKKPHIKTIANAYKAFGMGVSAHDCYLALRGVRTLAARLSYQKKTLDEVLKYLSKVPQVKQILAPSHKDFVDNKNFKKYFSGATPLFSIVLDKHYTTKQISKMFKQYKCFAIGASWGGFESLVRRVEDFSQIRTASSGKFDGTVIRYYLGLEDYKDLIADFKKGFETL